MPCDYDNSCFHNMAVILHFIKIPDFFSYKFISLFQNNPKNLESSYKTSRFLRKTHLKAEIPKTDFDIWSYSRDEKNSFIVK